MPPITDDNRIVKPRKPSSNANRPIVVVIDDDYLTEDGQIGSVRETLLADLRSMPPSIVVYAGESAKFLSTVQDRYRLCSSFNFRVSPIEREIFAPNNPRRLVLSLTSVAWFGWRETKRGRNTSLRNRYHLLMDPMTFGSDWSGDRTFDAYFNWARELREFCLAQGWDLKPTQGGVARQALRDPRFYPEARRKVPRATNDRVRENLPGNHYQLGVTATRDKEYSGEYLDQTKCHHWHAKTTPLPDANSLYGYGRFRKVAGATRTNPDRIRSFLAGFSGLVYGTVRRIPGKQSGRFVPSYLSKAADGPVYFYTADLELLASLGFEVSSIFAAWGSYDRDTGISKYAKWALDELGDKPPSWKKRLLLSPYGALATGARQYSVGYHRSKGGEAKTLRSKHGTELTVKYHQASRVAEPSTNNVLHRALIEASNRTETLMYANYLESIGHRVLCIYVDAVIVETDDDLPILLLEPWRNDQSLTRLRFLSDSQWIADQTERLPGVTGAQRKQYVSRGTVGKAAKLGTRAEQWDRANRDWIGRVGHRPALS
jgi:hypothetical protein